MTEVQAPEFVAASREWMAAHNAAAWSITEDDELNRIVFNEISRGTALASGPLMSCTTDACS